MGHLPVALPAHDAQAWRLAGKGKAHVVLRLDGDRACEMLRCSVLRVRFARTARSDDAAMADVEAAVWRGVPGMTTSAGGLAHDACAAAAHTRHLATFLPPGTVARAVAVAVPAALHQRALELAGEPDESAGDTVGLLLPDYANPPRLPADTAGSVVVVEVKPKRGYWPRPFPAAPTVERAFAAEATASPAPATRAHRRLGTPLYFMRECALAHRRGVKCRYEDVARYDPRDFFHGAHADVARAVARLLAAHENHAGGDTGAGRHAKIHVRLGEDVRQVRTPREAVRALLPSWCADVDATTVLANAVAHAVQLSGAGRGLLQAQRQDKLGSHAAAAVLERLIERRDATGAAAARLRQYLVAACASDVSILVALCIGSRGSGPPNDVPTSMPCAWRDVADWCALPGDALAGLGVDPRGATLWARVSVIDCDHKPLRKVFEHRKRDAEAADAWLRMLCV